MKLFLCVYMITFILKGFSFRIIQWKNSPIPQLKYFLSARTVGKQRDKEENWKFRRVLCRSILIGDLILLSIFGNMPHYSSVSAAVTDDINVTRFKSAFNELQNLDDNWNVVVKDQGDNIRRKLGTVYTPPKCESPLCGFSSFVSKFVQSHPDDLDLPSFEEPISEVLEAINQADFLAYSSIFSEYGNGGGGKDYIEDSHKQIIRAKNAMEQVIKVLNE